MSQLPGPEPPISCFQEKHLTARVTEPLQFLPTWRPDKKESELEHDAFIH